MAATALQSGLLFPGFSGHAMEKAISSTSSFISYAGEGDEDSSDDGNTSFPSTSGSPPPSPTRMTRASKLIIKEDKERDRRGVATFHLKTWEEQTWFERALHMGVADAAVYEKKPNVDRGPIKVHSPWRENFWILPRSLLAPALQQISLWVFPEYKWPVVLSYLVYLFSFFWFMTMSVQRLNHFALHYGTFDEKNYGRDRPVDRNVYDLFWLNVAFLTGRTVVDFVMNWNQHEVPIESFHWTFPIRLFLYLVLLDYLFYVWHRSTHHIETLWSLHASHHGTKHPSPLLSIDAISVTAEIVEFLVIPFMLAAVIPMTFHELYVAIAYTAYTEAAGHSGIRAVFAAPVTGPILSPFGLEITVEDHDLHHRYGKAGMNFGKQTMIFDWMFGTRQPREESPDSLYPNGIQTAPMDPFWTWLPGFGGAQEEKPKAE
ncbi:hypothetical protein T439DRAFT_330259 [Meredithblackwellia eburnea MCA 4105]